MIETGTNNQTTSGGRAGGSLLLWLGLLVPPAAWMIQLFSLYMLEDFISCTPGSRTPGIILGFGVRPIALTITLVLGLLTIGAGAMSFSLWKKSRPAEGVERLISAPAWMALAGIMNSLLFAVIILIKVAPPLLLGVCENPV